MDSHHKYQILCILIADTVFSDDEGMTKNSIRITFIARYFYVNKIKTKKHTRH